MSTRGNLSRREALAALAGWMGAGTALGRCAAAAEEIPGGDWIDAHVHVWTPDVDRYPLAAGYTPAAMKPASFTPDELMAHARPAGVSRVVLIQMSYYGFDNRYMLDVIDAHPKTYRGVAVIDSTRHPAATMREMAQAGVRGFRLYGRNTDQDGWLAAPGIDEMWRTGAAEGLAMCLLIDPGALEAVDRMCAKHPDTPVVIDHFARIGVDGTIRSAEVDQLCRLAAHRHTSVKISAFYALGAKQPPYLDLIPMIRRLLDAFGPQRLMWATDCPFQVSEHRYVESLALVRDRLDFLSAGDRRQLLAGTAERVFFS